MNPDTLVKVRVKDYYRLIKMLAIHEFHIATLFRYTAGMKIYSFKDILKELCEDFGVDVKDLEDVSFARFEK